MGTHDKTGELQLEYSPNDVHGSYRPVVVVPWLGEVEF